MFAQYELVSCDAFCENAEGWLVVGLSKLNVVFLV